MRWFLPWSVFTVVGFWLSAPVEMSAQTCPVPTSTAEQQAEAKDVFFTDALFYFDREKWHKALAALDAAGAWWPAVRTPFKRRYSVLSKKERPYEPFFRAGVSHQELGEFQEAMRKFTLAECREALSYETLEELRSRWDESKANRQPDPDKAFDLFRAGLEAQGKNWHKAAQHFWDAERLKEETGEKLPERLGSGGRFRDGYLPAFRLGESLTSIPCFREAVEPLARSLVARDTKHHLHGTYQRLISFVKERQDNAVEGTIPVCWQWCCLQSSRQ